MVHAKGSQTTRSTCEHVGVDNKERKEKASVRGSYRRKDKANRSREKENRGRGDPRERNELLQTRGSSGRVHASTSRYSHVRRPRATPLGEGVPQVRPRERAGKKHCHGSTASCAFF